MINPKLIQQLHSNDSDTDNNFSKLLHHTMGFSMLDLSLKGLFFLYFPSPISFLACFLLSLPSSLALFGLCLSKNGYNKKFLLPALFHHFFVYIIPLAFLLIALICALFSGAYIGGNANDPRSGTDESNDYQKMVTIVLFATTMLAFFAFQFHQMLHLYIELGKAAKVVPLSDLFAVAADGMTKGKMPANE